MSSFTIGMRALFVTISALATSANHRLSTRKNPNLDEYTEDRFSIKSNAAVAVSKTIISCPAMFKYKMSVSNE